MTHTFVWHIKIRKHELVDIEPKIDETKSYFDWPVIPRRILLMNLAISTQPRAMWAEN